MVANTTDRSHRHQGARRPAMLMAAPTHREAGPAVLNRVVALYLEDLMAAGSHDPLAEILPLARVLDSLYRLARLPVPAEIAARLDLSTP